jgi:3-hydroxy-3-methylglutaryl CoA synthase
VRYAFTWQVGVNLDDGALAIADQHAIIHQSTAASATKGAFATAMLVTCQVQNSQETGKR